MFDHTGFIARYLTVPEVNVLESLDPEFQPWFATLDNQAMTTGLCVCHADAPATIAAYSVVTNAPSRFVAVRLWAKSGVPRDAMVILLAGIMLHADKHAVSKDKYVVHVEVPEEYLDVQLAARDLGMVAAQARGSDTVVFTWRPEWAAAGV